MQKHHKNHIFNCLIQMQVNGQIIASYEEIAQKSETSRRSIARAISEFVSEGKIKRIHAKGRGVTNIYSITPPPYQPKQNV